MTLFASVNRPVNGDYKSRIEFAPALRLGRLTEKLLVALERRS